MWWPRKNKTIRTLAGLERSELASARDSAGFDFAALLRPGTATALLKVDPSAPIDDEMITAWERLVSRDSSVLACEMISSATPHVAITWMREAKAEKKDDSEILTRLATVLPDFYASTAVTLTPMTKDDVRRLFISECSLVFDHNQWPHINAEVEESSSAISVDDLSFASFDVMDDSGVDDILRRWCSEEGAASARFNRIFRPSDTDDPGRHCGVLTIFSPGTNHEILERIVDEVLGLLNPVQRLRIRRLYARQNAGLTAGLGIGAFAWNATTTRAA